MLGILKTFGGLGKLLVRYWGFWWAIAYRLAGCTFISFSFGFFYICFSDRYGRRYHPRGLGAARVLVYDQVLDLLTNRRELYAYFRKKDYIVFVFYLILSQVLKIPICFFCTATASVCAKSYNLLLCLLSRPDHDR